MAHQIGHTFAGEDLNHPVAISYAVFSCPNETETTIQRFRKGITTAESVKTSTLESPALVRKEARLRCVEALDID